MRSEVMPVAIVQGFIEEHRTGTSIFLNFSPLSTGLHEAGAGYSFETEDEYTEHLSKLAHVLRDRFAEVFLATMEEAKDPDQVKRHVQAVLEVAICPQPQMLDGSLFNYGEVYFWLPSLQLELEFVLKLQLALYQSVNRDPVEVDGLYVLFYGSGFRQT